MTWVWGYYSFRNFGRFGNLSFYRAKDCGLAAVGNGSLL